MRGSYRIHAIISLAVMGSVGAMAEEWTAHSIDREGKGADGLRLADVNGDGLMDLGSGWEEEGEVRVYVHPGPEEVKAPWSKVVAGKSKKLEDAVFTTG